MFSWWRLKYDEKEGSRKKKEKGSVNEENGGNEQAKQI
jgi:hypothetical protein